MRKLLALMISLLCSSHLFAEEKMMKAGDQKGAAYTAALQDIEKTLGIVPTFLKTYPPSALPGAWQSYKGIELAPTAVPGLYKELIGLAVAAQIPCHYCVYAHTQFAKLNGATDAQIYEAVATAASTREWSAILHSNPQSLERFQKEADEMFAYMKDPKHFTPAASPNLTQTQKEMLEMMGRVPSFVDNYPASGIDGAWNTFKSFEGSTDGAMPKKYRDLVSYAVSSQVPCNFCSYFDRKAAQMDGATEEEMKEAAGMAAITRRWSTVLNGTDQSMAQFKKEIDRIVAHVKSSMKAKK